MQEERRKVAKDFTGTKSRTKQAFASGVKIDSVLKKYATMGVDANDVGLFQVHTARMPYGEMTELTFDYQAQLNKITAVKEYFGRLPSGIREQFGHDPARMLAFMSDKRNFAKCVELGLFEKPDKKDEAGKAPPSPVGAKVGGTPPEVPPVPGAK